MNDKTEKYENLYREAWHAQIRQDIKIKCLDEKDQHFHKNFNMNIFKRPSMKPIIIPDPPIKRITVPKICSA